MFLNYVVCFVYVSCQHMNVSLFVLVARYYSGCVSNPSEFPI